MTERELLLLHAASTWFLTGLIWIVQLVHYPLFAYVERARFTAFEAEHCRRISWIVMPTMLLELATAAWLVVAPPAALPLAWSWTGLALLAVIWGSTALFSVPCHRVLERGFDERAHRRLVATNWVRTLAWSARALLSGAMLAR
ncbi:MAG: hypothetical protein IPN34_13920 [Planctomycetes bacterium]|nr:hypothetical protein [Planctomycetota bacterium]